MNIGKAIKLVLKRRGMTQKELARRINKSETAVSAMFKGTYQPSHNTLDSISGALQIPKSVLLFLTIEEEDVPKDRRAFFNLLEDSLKEVILKIFETNKE